MIEGIFSNWQALVGFITAAVLQAYLFLKKVNKLEHRIEVLEKDQDEIKEMLKEIRDDIKGILRQSSR